MFKSFKNIKPATLISHLIVTLAYPVVRAFTAKANRLLLFTNALTIIAALLIAAGIIYNLYLKGDFDRTSYIFKRSINKDLLQKPYEDYEKDAKENREDAFNYPLCFGIVYLIVSAILAYGVV